MAKVIELRKVIQSTLKAIHPNVIVGGISKSRVHFQDAPADSPYPYLVYDLPNSNDDGLMERFVMDVDGWDDSTDTTAIETLMSNVDQGLHRKVVVVEDIALIFYRENRIPLLDDDPRIRRRKYVYQVRTYGGM